MNGFSIISLALFVMAAETPMAQPGHLFLIQKEGKWGYIDQAGRIAIKPVFEQALDFSDGMAAVREGKNWGYIDSSGKIAVPIRIEQLIAFPFCGDGAVVYDQGASMAIVDRTGKVTRKQDWEKIVDCHGGILSVRNDRKWGFFKASGEAVVAPKYDGVGQFAEGLGAANSQGKWGFVDQGGNWVVEPRFDEAGRFSEGLAPVRVEDKWGYIDRAGKFVIEPAFSLAFPFSQGLARIYVWGQDKLSRAGFVDKTGKLVIRPQYSVAGDFSSSRALVRVGNKFGFIDSQGRMVIAAKYDFAADFTGGLAQVKNFPAPDKSVMSYVNSDGKVVWSSDTP